MSPNEVLFVARMLVGKGRCHRVVVDPAGYAVNAKEAKERYGVVPAVVFIRKDGWSLGAPRDFADVAASIWKGDWIAVSKPIPEDENTWGVYDVDCDALIGRV